MDILQFLFAIILSVILFGIFYYVYLTYKHKKNLTLILDKKYFSWLFETGFKQPVVTQDINKVQFCSEDFQFLKEIEYLAKQ